VSYIFQLLGSDYLKSNILHYFLRHWTYCWRYRWCRSRTRPDSFTVACAIWW